MDAAGSRNLSYMLATQKLPLEQEFTYFDGPLDEANLVSVWEGQLSPSAEVCLGTGLSHWLVEHSLFPVEVSANGDAVEHEEVHDPQIELTLNGFNAAMDSRHESPALALHRDPEELGACTPTSRVNGMTYQDDGHIEKMARYGLHLIDDLWKCAFPACRSQSIFRRPCDLRKHYMRHLKVVFCRYPGCPAAKQRGFSTSKDRDRHEARHKPDVMCEWQSCRRLFSRVDNMVSYSSS
jgi:hypothetical protein